MLLHIGSRGGSIEKLASQEMCYSELKQITVVKVLYLGEEAGPVRLEVDSSSLEDGGDLLGGDGDIVISEDEGGVDAGELSGHGGVQVS